MPYKWQKSFLLAMLLIVLSLVSVACAAQSAPAVEAGNASEAADSSAEDEALAEDVNAEPDAAAQPGETFTFGVSTNALANEHNRKLFETTQAAIESRGHEAVMVNANGETVQHIEDVENLIQRGVDAILIQNGDTQSLAATIKRAADEGIPVISMETGYTPVFFVTPNDFVIGATIATYLSGQVGNTGQVATFYHTDHPAIRTRGAMIDAVVNEYSTLEEVARHRTIFPGTTEDAYAAMQSILLANPDIVAVLCSQDLEALGVARALEEAGRDDIITIGVDGEQDVLRNIKNGGNIIATVIQDVEQESELAVEAAIALASGEEIESKVIFVPFDFVTAENVDEYLDE